MKVEQFPVIGQQRVRVVEFSDRAFMSAARRIGCVRKVKSKWNAERYLDEFVSGMELPMDEDYLTGLIEAFAIHRVIRLLPEGDE
jgi:hypothetical protein